MGIVKNKKYKIAPFSYEIPNLKDCLNEITESEFEKPKKHIKIPPHISKIGVYTGHSFLAVGLYAFYDNYNSLGVVLLGLYLTTILHWRRIYSDSIIKKMDIVMSVTVITKISLHDSIRWGENRYIWL